MGFTKTRLEGDTRHVITSVTRKEAAKMLGVRVEDIPEVPPAGTAFGNQSNRFMVYQCDRDWENERNPVLFTDRAEALATFYGRNTTQEKTHAPE